MGEYLLLMKFHGVSPQDVQADHGKDIHKEYMGAWGPGGSKLGQLASGSGPPGDTKFVVRLRGRWDFGVLYEGPEQSTADLESMVLKRLAPGQAVDLLTLDAREITGQF